MRFTTIILLFWSLMALSSAKATVLDGDTTSFRHFEEIVVSHTAKTKEVIPVQTLEGEQLQSLAAHSVADAVRYFSGTQIKDYGGVGGLKTINVRSLGANHTAVFFDGIEIGNSQNGVVDLGRFSLDNMEAISVYNGQKSSIFQSAKDYSSASALYMQTRKPTFDDTKSYNLNIGVKAGSFKLVNPTILWEQRLNDKLRLSISGEYTYNSGEYPFTYSTENGYDTTAIRENGDITSYRAEAALFGNLKGGEWQTKLYFYNSQRGYPGAVVREEPGIFKNEDRQWDRNIFVQSSLRKRVNEWYSLKVNGKYANDFLHYKTGENSSVYANNRYLQQEGYLSLVNMFSLVSWLNFALASDLQYNTLDADISNFVFPRRYLSLTSAAVDFSYKKLKAQASLLYTHSHDKSNGESGKNIDKFTPTVVLSYRPFNDEQLAIRAFYKRIFRMPTLNDLYYTTIGNVELDPEFATQYNIGATYRFTPKKSFLRTLELQTDLYYNQIEDKIVALPTSNQFRWSMMNLGYVEILGVDVVADTKWQFGKVKATARVNYTYQQSEDLTSPSSDYYRGQTPYTPWHSGSLIVGGEYVEWGVNYSYSYTGERYTSVANITENYIEPWYTSDVSIWKKFALSKLNLRVTTEVNNLFNQQYEVVQCYPMPGINYKVKVNVIF